MSAELLSAAQTLLTPEREPLEPVGNRLLERPEIKECFALGVPSLIAEDFEKLRGLVPSFITSLADILTKRDLALSMLLQARAELDDSSVEYTITSRRLLATMVTVAQCGLITDSEIVDILKVHNDSWIQYWSEESTCYHLSKVFEPTHIRYRDTFDKHIALNNAFAQSKLYRERGQRVVTVFGTFDFHSGHAELINSARNLAGKGLVIVLLTSDEEAQFTRPHQQNIMSYDHRLEVVASQLGVDFCVQLPWGDEFKDQQQFDEHIKGLHQGIGAHYRLIGDLEDSNVPEILKQCVSSNTTLAYRQPTRNGDASSSNLRRKLYS